MGVAPRSQFCGNHWTASTFDINEEAVDSATKTCATSNFNPIRGGHLVQAHINYMFSSSQRWSEVRT